MNINTKYRNIISLRIEWAANLAIIASVAVLTLTLIRASKFKGKPLKAPEVNAVGAFFSMPLKNDNIQKDTLVFVLQLNCPYCVESVVFHKRLLEDEQIKSNYDTIAIFPNSVQKGEEYLSTWGISVNKVYEVSFKSFKIEGTPTLLVINSSGIITGVWKGKLPAVEENKLFSVLKRLD